MILNVEKYVTESIDDVQGQKGNLCFSNNQDILPLKTHTHTISIFHSHVLIQWSAIILLLPPLQACCTVSLYTPAVYYITKHGSSWFYLSHSA